MEFLYFAKSTNHAINHHKRIFPLETKKSCYFTESMMFSINLTHILHVILRYLHNNTSMKLEKHENNILKILICRNS